MAKKGGLVGPDGQPILSPEEKLTGACYGLSRDILNEFGSSYVEYMTAEERKRMVSGMAYLLFGLTQGGIVPFLSPDATKDVDIPKGNE